MTYGPTPRTYGSRMSLKEITRAMRFNRRLMDGASYQTVAKAEGISANAVKCSALSIRRIVLSWSEACATNSVKATLSLKDLRLYSPWWRRQFTEFNRRSPAQRYAEFLHRKPHTGGQAASRP